MDQDRWDRSWLKMGTKKSNVDKDSNLGKVNSEQKTSAVNIDRYKHDMAQAEALRQGMRSRKETKKSEGPKNSSHITEDDVRLGLSALDEADDMRERGDLSGSLKVSELAIELLIEFLRTDVTMAPLLDREFVTSRVQAALSDAEALKHHIKGTRSTEESTNPESGVANSVINSLSAALHATRNAKGISNKSTSPPSLQSTGQCTASPRIRKKKKATSNNSESIVSIKTPSNRPVSIGDSDTHPYFNTNDPLVATIKQDLYVDPSKLEQTSWNDIAGLADAKQALQEAAILPLMRPDLFTGLRSPKNILLYGPPGTGKTMLVRAVAKESECLLFVATASALTSKWHGEGEKLVRTLFEVARAAAPSIIFVDEMDALLSSRKSDGEHEASRRFKTEFMTQMDGIVKGAGTQQKQGKHVLVLAATNTPWDIDGAILRRFPRRIYIPLPDSTTRKALLQKLLKKAGNHNLAKEDIKKIVKKTAGFSGSDIASIASEAAFGPLRSLGGMAAIRGVDAKDIRPISVQDFETAISQATKSVPPQLLHQYDEWKKQQAAP